VCELDTHTLSAGPDLLSRSKRPWARQLAASLLWALVGPASAPDDDLTDLTSGGWFAGVWVVVAPILVAPFAEEFLFRRVAFSALRAQGERRLGWRGGLVVGALLSSALFASAHVAGGASWSATPPLFVNGLALVVLAVLLERLGPPRLRPPLAGRHRAGRAAARRFSVRRRGPMGDEG
jgi:membrane protease YdiL (CAAX protease family)